MVLDLGRPAVHTLKAFRFNVHTILVTCLLKASHQVILSDYYYTILVIPVFCRLDRKIAILTNPILCFPFLPVHVGAVVLQHVHVHEVLAAMLAFILEPLNF